MAEILLSLTIIGVVAAIILPALIGNFNERLWNTKRIALYSRMSQAIALLPSLKGYGVYNVDGTGSIYDTCAEDFVVNGLGKELKFNNVCVGSNIEDCNFPKEITAYDGKIAYSSIPKTLSELQPALVFDNYGFNSSSKTYSDTNAVAFETQSGETVLTFYNPDCIADPFDVVSWREPNIAQYTCVNFLYDLNGNKGPNKAGKDVGFFTAFYSAEPKLVAPIPIVSQISSGFRITTNFYDISAKCQAHGDNSRAPNWEELKSLLYNRPLVGTINTAGYYISSTPYTESKIFAIHPKSLVRISNGKGGSYLFLCVEK